MAQRKTRQLPQEEASCPFTQGELRVLGDLSVQLGRLHWQNTDVGTHENQVAILVQQQERLNALVVGLLMRSL